LTITGTSGSLTHATTVTLTVNAAAGTGTGTLAASPLSLTFNYRMGGRMPSSRTLAITSTGGSTPFTATESDPWLTITPTSGKSTPGNIQASVNPAGMAPGTYGGQINVSAPNRTTTTVAVTLSITSGSGGGGGTSGGMFAQTYMYDPTQSGALAAAWVDNLGTTPHSTSDPLNQGLVLAKNATAPAGSLTGAVITNVQSSLTELGYDYRDGGQCTATSPRFVVVTTGGTHVVQGCNKVTVPAPTKGWSRVRFNLTDSMQTSPVILPGDSVSSITLVLDQGPVTGSSAAGGLAIIDNIDVNGTFAGKGTTSTPAPAPTPRDD
jgi:BACON domain-containing protein